MYKQFKKVSAHTPLFELSRIFDKDPFAIVTTEQRCYGSGGDVETKHVIFGVVTRIDLLTFITGEGPHNSPSSSHHHSNRDF
jgi:cystathionine beta-synthase